MLNLGRYHEVPHSSVLLLRTTETKQYLIELVAIFGRPAPPVSTT